MNKIEKIDFLLPNVSQYGVLHHFTKKIYKAFKRKGVTCRLLEGSDRYFEPMKDPPDLMIGFNGIYRTPEGEYISDFIKKPFLSILVDPFYRYYPITKSDFTIIGCEDLDHCKYLNQANFARNIFIPHAVEKELLEPFEKREYYDIVMLSTYIDYEKRRAQWEGMFPSHIIQLMDQTVEATFEDDNLSFMDAFQNLFNGWLMRGGVLDPRKTNFFRIFEELEIYIKGKEKIDLLKALRGVKVHVWGASLDSQDWTTLFYDSPHIIPHKSVTYNEAINIMKHSKIVLNACLKNKRGAHERVFTGMACRALVATNSTSFMNENFSDHHNVVLYSHSDYEDLNEQLLYLLSNKKVRQEITQNGHQAVANAHTWDHRADTILKSLNEIDLDFNL